MPLPSHLEVLPTPLRCGFWLNGTLIASASAMSWDAGQSGDVLIYSDGDTRLSDPATGRADVVEPVTITGVTVQVGDQAEWIAILIAASMRRSAVIPGKPIAEFFPAAGTYQLARSRASLILARPAEEMEMIIGGGTLEGSTLTCPGPCSVIYVPVLSARVHVGFQYGEGIIATLSVFEETWRAL